MTAAGTTNPSLSPRSLANPASEGEASSLGSKRSPGVSQHETHDRPEPEGRSLAGGLGGERQTANAKVYPVGLIAPGDPAVREALECKEQREAWVDLLSEYQWDWFATLTFKHPQYDGVRALRMFQAWLFEVHRRKAEELGLCRTVTKPKFDGYGRQVDCRKDLRGPFINRWKKNRDRPVWVVGIEKHKNGSNHLHAVVRLSQGLGEIRRDEAWGIWRLPRSQGGMDLGWARVEPPKDQDDVRGYVSKYVTKGGELHLSPSFSRASLHRC